MSMTRQRDEHNKHDPLPRSKWWGFRGFSFNGVVMGHKSNKGLFNFVKLTTITGWSNGMTFKHIFHTIRFGFDF